MMEMIAMKSRLITKEGTTLEEDFLTAGQIAGIEDTPPLLRFILGSMTQESWKQWNITATRCTKGCFSLFVITYP